LKSIHILKDLYLFSSYQPQIDLTFNQYLLLGKEPLLIHSGDQTQAIALISRLNSLLHGIPPAYILISHFESDECGGLNVLLKAFPAIKPICSAVTARQLKGFGITGEAIVKSPGEYFETPDYKLFFINYPSEVHLWNGLLALETERKILFSSDLFIARGDLGDNPVITASQEEIQEISPVQIPSPVAREELLQTLSTLSIGLVAPGHGQCLKL
jgi:flavorubredoxin